MNKQITKLYVFTNINPDGTEGIVSTQVGNHHFPLVCSDDEVLEMMKQTAKNIPAEIKLYKFTNKEEVRI